MTHRPELFSAVMKFCGRLASGRRQEARALLGSLSASSGGPDRDEAQLRSALEGLWGYVEEREAKLTELIAELAALRAQQESRAEKLTRENSDLRAGLHGGFKEAAALTNNPVMRMAFKQAARVASAPAPVLITGETGSGKGVLARFIHYTGARAKLPLIGLNCAAIPATLLESELFGIEKGVASGVRERPGHFECASGGTLFLDEIGDMPLDCQAKILKAIESESVVRVGGRKALPVDVRLISATHRNLEEACAEKAFRQDLFYRLKVIHIHIPPLRERREDIPPLAAGFLRAAARRYGLTAPAFDPDSLRLLENYAWPGNVRELEHEVERAVLLADGPALRPDDFSFFPQRAERDAGTARLAGNLAEKLRSHPDLLQSVLGRLAAYSSKAAPFETTAGSRPPASTTAPELELVQKALNDCRGNKTHAAQRLGITREGLRKKLKRLKLT